MGNFKRTAKAYEAYFDIILGPIWGATCDIDIGISLLV